MKLFKGVVTFLLFSTADASLSIYNNFLAPTEIEFYKSIPVSENNKGSCKGADRIFGHVNLDKDMRSRIQDANAKNCSSSSIDHYEEQDDIFEEMEVRTSFIHRTTERHLDRVNGVGHEHVSFVFLNTNDNAYFIHGDTEVPAVAGSMVTFAGDVYHHTRVNSGHIHLLGPFDSDTYEPIGCGVTIGCCGFTVNTEATCLSACDNPKHGVICHAVLQTNFCSFSGACEFFSPGAAVAGNPFLCCGEAVDNLDACNDACQLKANSCETPGQTRGVEVILCTANTLLPGDCTDSWLQCLKEGKA